jgi:diguanylate cyclase (GGDEF)-like protein
MREILELCIELDRMASETYEALARTCEDDEIGSAFGQLAKEERVHVDWWTDLLMAWEAGLVPDIADEHHLLRRLRDIRAELRSVSPTSCEGMSTDDVLDLAARFEFFMLDPLFGELVDLMQPGGKLEVREAYARHILRLIELIERRYTRPGLATFLAGVLRRAYRDQQRLSVLAMRDQLTGLQNRRGLLGHLTQWLSWSARYSRPVGLVLLDVDHFKEINDSYGHEAGDKALASIADALSMTVRASDIVGRFGGDEFLVLAPEADGVELDGLMHRLVRAVASLPLNLGVDRVHLSVSTGAAWAPGGMSISPEQLIAKADRAMYEAKHAGRNRAGEAVEAGVS